MRLTETVTFDDLIAQHERERSDLRDAYDDLVEFARDEYGDEEAEWPDSVRQTAAAYDATGQSIEQRVAVLERLRDHDAIDGDTFEIRMLSGRETMRIDTHLKRRARREDVDRDVISHERNAELVDAAVVTQPDAFPTDAEGDPRPSDLPEAVVMSLVEAVNTYNKSGSVDFRASGFADRHDWVGGSGSSATPTPSATSSTDSETPTPDATTPSAGDK